MEKNKYFCPNCGTEMIVNYDKPALNLTCPKCGCKITSTKWEEIDLDDTKYKILLEVVSDPNIEQIKFISKLAGLNYPTSKALLKNGGLVFEGLATEILEKKLKLNKENIRYTIEPFFKY